MGLKQLVILSGKGGTGKTSLAAAFAHLAYTGPERRRAVLADADVDAANLELVLQPKKGPAIQFFGGAVAVIEAELCEGCGTCAEICRFEALIEPGTNQNLAYQVDPIACDGCAACVYQCPTQAIQMETQLAGSWYISDSRYGPLVHADLLPAQENSGKLVTMVKQQARLLGLDSGADLVIVDGPPGIGCPVISAASGADLALLVTEPTTAGLHDLERAWELMRHFRLPALVCINKADLYPEGAERIRAFCDQNEILLAGNIPYDEAVSWAMVMGEPVTAYRPNSAASLGLVELWQSVCRRL